MAEPVISIEPISDELILAYRASGMKRGNSGGRALEWAFGRDSASFAVARHDGRIVGISGYIQNRVQLGHLTGNAVQAVDSFVLDSMRGKGVFTRLARAYDEHAVRSGTDLIWGFPNDNAAPAWFGKLGWHNHRQVPFLIKVLRTGFFCRKLGLPLDFPLTMDRDQRLCPVNEIGDWADLLWEQTSPSIGVGVVRDRDFLHHRLFAGPQADQYRVVAAADDGAPSIVATRQTDKHGGKIAYLMEALGGASMKALLKSELGRMAAQGVEIVLAWSFPWSPNYHVLRNTGFLPMPERFRPIRIWFGSAPKTAAASPANQSGQWYLSYLDSDTV
ncbi:GNAT family N-acetyltransferase (plasmid) [Cereibacter azotoformans]|uniref:GNAT family N-acetyltransferase n=1 Tax=Cereibacter azotoformans TaxID=43057 RepID=UPI003B20C8D7